MTTDDLTARLAALIKGEFPCSCGRPHPVELREIHVGPDALEKAVDYVVSLLPSQVVLVSDETTYAVAGKRLEERIRAEGAPARSLILPLPLVPDERAVQTVREAVRSEDGDAVLVAVGSGTIHDLTRYVASKEGQAFISFPTAPSVDGFASSVAPLIVRGIKKTFPARMPEAVFADTGILREAPYELIAAGFGDVLGKATAIADWRLSHAVNDEWYCPEIAELVEAAVKEVVARRRRLKERREEAVRSLIEGLLVTGLAIQMAGSSRPASGAEHHLSHYWEMRTLWSGSREHYHGAKVGAATPIIASIYERVRALFTKVDWDREGALDASREWEVIRARVDREYGPLAESMKEEIQERYTPARTEERQKRIRSRQGQARRVIEAFPWDSDGLREILREAEAPATPFELGIEPDWVRAAILVAKEVRPRYTVLQLADDLGILEEAARRLSQP